jgi:hypothetical protein
VEALHKNSYKNEYGGGIGRELCYIQAGEIIVRLVPVKEHTKIFSTEVGYTAK